MSSIGIVMDGLLIVLILAAIGFGLRLEKKLKALREGQAAFGQSVGELNIAAGKAQAALAELRAAGEETDMLHERILAARQLKADLEQLTARGRSAPAATPREPVRDLAREPARDPALDALAAKVAALQAQPITDIPASAPPLAAARLLQALAERRAEAQGETGPRDDLWAEPAPARRDEPLVTPFTPRAAVRPAAPEDDLFEPQRLSA